VTGRLRTNLRLDSVNWSMRVQMANHLPVNEAQCAVWRGDVFQVSIGVATRGGPSSAVWIRRRKTYTLNHQLRASIVASYSEVRKIIARVALTNFVVAQRRVCHPICRRAATCVSSDDSIPLIRWEL
jgi:hypothetical protein